MAADRRVATVPEARHLEGVHLHLRTRLQRRARRSRDVRARRRHDRSSATYSVVHELVPGVRRRQLRHASRRARERPTAARSTSSRWSTGSPRTSRPSARPHAALGRRQHLAPPSSTVRRGLDGRRSTCRRWTSRSRADRRGRHGGDRRSRSRHGADRPLTRTPDRRGRRRKLVGHGSADTSRVRYPLTITTDTGTSFDVPIDVVGDGEDRHQGEGRSVARRASRCRLR